MLIGTQYPSLRSQRNPEKGSSNWPLEPHSDAGCAMEFRSDLLKLDLLQKPCGTRLLQVLRIEHTLAIMFTAAFVPALIDKQCLHSCEKYRNTTKSWRGGRLARLPRPLNSPLPHY
jgi:hypothetical protein